MALSAKEIVLCNAALMRIGQNLSIAVDGETTNHYRAANSLYPLARDYVLTAREWEFATKRGALADKAASTYSLWDWQYTYPTDCQKVRRVLGAGATRRDERLPYQIMNTGTALKILTNEDDAGIEYTVAVTDPDLFDPAFYSAVAYYLASELAMALKATPEIAKGALDAFSSIMKAASDPSQREGWDETGTSLTSGTTSTHLAICNMALSRLGIKYAIASLTEHTEPARQCSIHYGESVSNMLRRFPWPFATTQAALVENTAAIIDDYTFAYTLPTNLAKIQQLVSPYGPYVRHDLKPPYTTGFYVAGGVQVLYTDLEAASIQYTTTAVDSNNFDAGFRDALAWKLASEIGPALGVDLKVVQYCVQQFMVTLSMAAASAMNESNPGPEPDGTFIASRW